MKILLIETHEAFAQVAVRGFLGTHEVTIRTSAAEAIRDIDADNFDAVLVTYALSDGDGCTVVRHIRKSGKDPLIVGISAEDDENEYLLAAGACIACNKMNFDQIEEILQQFFR